jgi:hypothetical protein
MIEHARVLGMRTASSWRAFGGIALALAAGSLGCSSTSTGSGFGAEGADGGTGANDSGAAGTGVDSGQGTPPSFGQDGGSPASDASPDGSVVITTTIYANTDDSLYSMDPKTMAITLVGKFAGMGGGTNDKSITDVAVNATDEVFVNTESAIYKATLPQSAGGTVQLTKVAAIALKTGQRFYALAFAPAGVLGQGEALVGGDGSGELWSIDQTNGATNDLGNFGTDPNNIANVLALSGDIVFYLDGANKPTGMATIRSCTKGTSTCSKTSDYLAGIDMTALAQAYATNTPSTALLSGIYGGSATQTGSGTGFGDLFGLGAWEGSVYGFQRGATAKPPELVSLDTTNGKGTMLSSAFTFTNGWSGAGVTTKVTVTVPPPPPPPPPPK